MPWGSSDISYVLYGKQGHLLRAVNQPWGSREHLQSMHGADVSQQQGLMCCPRLAWSKNTAVSSPMSGLVDGVVTWCRDIAMAWSMILEVAWPMTVMVAQAVTRPPG